MSSSTKVPSGTHLVDAHYTRGDQQYEAMMAKVAQDGYKCPFCTMAVHPKPIIRHSKNKTWFVTERHEVPASVASYLLIIPRRHLVNHRAMTAADDAAVRELVTWAEATYGLRGFGLAIRSGNSKLTGATVRHLHYHLVTPKINPKDRKRRAIPYHFPIG